MNVTMPIWMQRWLGQTVGPGEGTACRLEYHWPWPPWLTLLAALVAVAAIVAIYQREGRQTRRSYRLMLATMRIALLVIVAGMIAQLEVSFQRTGLPYVAVIVDDSRSMGTVDNYPESLLAALKDRLAKSGSPGRPLSRWNLATTLLTENDAGLLTHLTDNYKLRFYYLTGLRASRAADVPGIAVELKTAEPLGDTTRLGDAVRSVLDELRGASPAAIIMLTDGVNTEGPSLSTAAAHARRRGVPLFLIGLGSDQPVRDLKLSDLLVDDVVFVNDIIPFRMRLTGSGFQGQKATVVLRQEGQTEPLSRVEVTVAPDGQSQEVRVSYRPNKEGQFRYTLDVEPPAGGLPIKHPALTATIQVRKEKIRVLMAAGYPNWEYRFLRSMLVRDETIELHTVLQDADPEYPEQDKVALATFPVRREDLFAYDVVILGDVNPAILGQGVLQNLADFVDQPGKGGALVLEAGPSFMPQAFRDTPIGRLMPFDPRNVRYPDPDRVVSESFVVQPTELGLASPMMQLGDTPEQSRAIWQKLPPLDWMVELGDLKPAARRLAENPLRTGPDGQHLPVIVLQYVGAGKVLFYATDETWHWRRRVGDVFFARHWIQSIRFLSRAKLSEGDRTVSLSTDRREYRAGDPVRVQVRFSDERLAPSEDNGVTVVVEHQGHKTQRIELQRRDAGRGLFGTTLPPPPAGGYHVWIATPTLEGRAPAADFVVAPPQGELARTKAETGEMRQAADITKGHYYAFTETASLIDDLPEGRQVPIEDLPPVALWNKWPVVLAFLILLIGEWILRKRGGMI